MDPSRVRRVFVSAAQAAVAGPPATIRQGDSRVVQTGASHAGEL